MAVVPVQPLPRLTRRNIFRSGITQPPIRAAPVEPRPPIVPHHISPPPNDADFPTRWRPTFFNRPYSGAPTGDQPNFLRFPRGPVRIPRIARVARFVRLRRIPVRITRLLRIRRIRHVLVRLRTLVRTRFVVVPGTAGVSLCGILMGIAIGATVFGAVAAVIYAFLRGPGCTEKKLVMSLEMSEGDNFPGESAICQTLSDIITGIPSQEFTTRKCSAEQINSVRRRRKRQLRAQMSNLRMRLDLMVTIEVCPALGGNLQRRRALLSGLTAALQPNYPEPSPLPRLFPALVVRTSCSEDDLDLGFDDRMIQMTVETDMFLAFDPDTDPEALPDPEAMCMEIMSRLESGTGGEMGSHTCVIRRITSEGVTFTITTEEEVDPTRRTPAQFAATVAQTISATFNPAGAGPPDFTDTALSGLGGRVQLALRGFEGARGDDNDVIIDETFPEMTTASPEDDSSVVTESSDSTEGSGDSSDTETNG